VVGDDLLDVDEDVELLHERLAARQQLLLLRRVEPVHLRKLLVCLLQKLPLLRVRGSDELPCRIRFQAIVVLLLPVTSVTHSFISTQLA
jgi:hypothetical protein